jgi:hypothetical protein
VNDPPHKFTEAHIDGRIDDELQFWIADADDGANLTVATALPRDGSEKLGNDTSASIPSTKRDEHVVVPALEADKFSRRVQAEF